MTNDIDIIDVDIDLVAVATEAATKVLRGVSDLRAGDMMRRKTALVRFRQALRDLAGVEAELRKGLGLGPAEGAADEPAA